MLIILEYAVTAIVCLITAVVIQRIYKKERRTDVGTDGINGIMWFGLAILIWGLGALANLIGVTVLGLLPTSKPVIYLGVFLSLLNSMFILLSLPSIKYSGRQNIVVRMVDRFSEREFIMIYVGVMCMLAFVFIMVSFVGNGIDNSLIWLIDIPISVVVAFALLHALNRAFETRSMRFMNLPSFALFILIVIAVTHRIVPSGFVKPMREDTWALLGTVTAISFKFLFIVLFSILLYSWKFLSEKEEKQFRLESLLLEKEELLKTNLQLKVANESHLNTIGRLKKELETLKETTKIELSVRQKEVLANLECWGDQKSYTEIAEAMHISVDGFQAHIHQIKKLLNISGADGKNLLISYAKENDLMKYATLKKGGF
ncbi:hypothetical protein ACEZ3G_01070 [Maribacter algicola]|uniref:Uncharacterized protein n=1 Tax=Meishania litoralis TaxID=3434685 RepID=A0ACC7LFY3_9FLAO